MYCVSLIQEVNEGHDEDGDIYKLDITSILISIFMNHLERFDVTVWWEEQ